MEQLTAGGRDECWRLELRKVADDDRRFMVHRWSNGYVSATVRVSKIFMHSSLSILGIAFSTYFSWRFSLLGFPLRLILIIRGLICGEYLLYLFGNFIFTEFVKAYSVVAQATSSVKTIYSTAEKRVVERYSAILKGTVNLGIKQGITKGLAVGSTGLSFAIWALLAAEKRIVEGYSAILKGTVNLGIKQVIGKGLAVGSTGLSFAKWALLAAEKRIVEGYSAILNGTVNLGIKQRIAKGLVVGSTCLLFAIWALLAWYGSRLIMYHGESGGRIYTATLSFILAGLYLGVAIPAVKHFIKAPIGPSRILRRINFVLQYEKWRRRGLKFQDELNLLRGGTIATEDFAWAAPMFQETAPPPPPIHHNDNHSIMDLSPDRVSTTQPSLDENETTTLAPSSGRMKGMKISVPQVSRCRKKVSAKEFSHSMTRLIDVIEMRNMAGSSCANASPSEDPTSIPSCVKILSQMVEMEQGGLMWLHAMHLLLRKDIREMFVAIEDENLRYKFITSTPPLG